jgi:hypothetical protein
MIMDHSTRGLGTLSSPLRNHYFYGKLMDVPHFEMEQGYGNKKRWLLNRLGLGYGVLCGLGLTVEENRICIAPGVAIDRYGREIIVPHEVCVDPWAVTDECGRPMANALSKTEAHRVYFCLGYRECQTDFMPVLVMDCNVKEDCLPGTTVEGYVVLVKEGQTPDPTRLERVCEIVNSDQAPGVKRENLCELLSKETCFHSEDQENCVVLGGARLRADGTIGVLDPCSARTTLISNERLLEMVLCLTGSRGGSDVPPVQEELTHIEGFVGVNLDNNDNPEAGSEKTLHDQEIPASGFPSRLIVTFSGDVPTFPANGKAWFIVTLEVPSRQAGFGTTNFGGLPTTVQLDGVVALNASTATFTFNENVVTGLRGLTSQTILNLLCRIMVKCDFLLDARGKAVDGNHLGGKLPSGDGVPGGDFESWFTVSVPRSDN